jgi:hemolysin activation/secretion protein
MIWRKKSSNILFFFICFIIFSITTKLYAQQTQRTQSGAAGIIPSQVKTSPPQISIQKNNTLSVVTGGPAIKVNKFEIIGNTRISSAKLNSIVLPYEGKELTLAELEKVAGLITNLYHQKGYFLAHAYIPAQKIKKGIIKIMVIEGRVGKITVTGNKHYTTNFLLSRMQPLKKAGVITRNNLEKPLLTLNSEEPKLNVNALLSPGSEFGTTNIKLIAKDSLPYNLTLFYNNFGNKYTGDDRLGVLLDLGNITGHGDVLSLGEVFPFPTTNKEWEFYNKVGYSIPVGTSGLRLGADYIRSEYNVGAALSALNIIGESTSYGLSLNYPIIGMTNESLNVFGSLNHNYYKNTILGYTSSKDQITSMTAGINGQKTGPFLGTVAHNWYQLSIEQGLGGFLGGEDHPTQPSVPGANSQFTKFNMDLSSTIKLGRCSLILRGAGQLSSKTLPLGEDFTIGGEGTVRGYPEAEYLGDEGYTANAELRTPFWFGNPLINHYAQWAFFIDNGGVRIEDPLPGETSTYDITGYGLGVRVAATKYFSFRIDAGWPLKGLQPSDNKSPHYYFEAVARF